VSANAAPVDFYFDLSSPYGCLASQKIEAVVHRHGRTLAWHPMLLGVVFKKTGTAPLTEIPLKGEYSKRDFARSARFHGLPVFEMPPRFPIPTQVPARLLMWLKLHSPGRMVPATKAFFHAYFYKHIDISIAENALAVLAPLEIDQTAGHAALESPEVKDALREEVDGAIARGVFGSPFFIVDGEPFWGLDRLDQFERWLATGGF
jgi:2-hydroxychromene-2-carboxylate isomerase